MEPEHQSESLPALARGVIALFQEHLAEVQFADLDLGLLHTRARELVAAQVEVERVVAALERARAEAGSRAQALLVAQRGLSYARIYAEADPALAARVAEIAEPRSAGAEAGTPRKRGRPRKQDEGGLFSGAEGEGEPNTLM